MAVSTFDRPLKAYLGIPFEYKETLTAGERPGSHSLTDFPSNSGLHLVLEKYYDKTVRYSEWSSSTYRYYELAITGTLLRTGNFTAIFKFDESNYTYYGWKTSTETYNFKVTGEPNPVSITTYSLPTAKEGTPYTVPLTATVTTKQSVTWSITNGTLPNGLALSNSGIISGVPDLTF